MDQTSKNSPLFINVGPGLSMILGLLTISTWNTAGRPKNAKIGTFGFNFQTKNLEYWDGDSWYGAAMSEN